MAHLNFGCKFVSKRKTMRMVLRNIILLLVLHLLKTIQHHSSVLAQTFKQTITYLYIKSVHNTIAKAKSGE